VAPPDQLTGWWEKSEPDGFPTQGGGRVIAEVEIRGRFRCTGCGQTITATTHVERDPAHVENEITASQFDTNSAAIVHANTCTARPEGTT
jgi:hypothetical protein